MTSVRYCTPEWLEENAQHYRETPRFQEEMKRLTTKVCFQINAKPEWGIEEDIIFAAYVNKGELERLGFISKEDAFREADFVMSASPDEWKSLLRKKSKFIADFMLGKVSLEKGSKVGIFNVAPHSNTFIEALNQVELRFQDELSPEELEEYRTYFREFRERLGV
ncbi:MAG: SCP2 sterol-binding domain-containing protein [Anaerolineales bacterium]|jgi:putative sterol carrier protein